MTHVVRVALEPVPVHNQEEYRCIVVTTGMDQYLAYTPLAQHPQIDDQALLEALAQMIQFPVQGMLCLGRGDLHIQQDRVQLTAFCPDGMPLDESILAIFIEPLRLQLQTPQRIVA